ncbi:MAG: nucleotidyltransferase family protein, partial [Halobacteriota archaeon]
KVEEISRTLKENETTLKDKYKVKEIGIFGSWVRGEQRVNKSDLDVLVDFEEPVSLLEFVELERYLSELLGIKVDLVMKNALKPRIGKRILEEVVYV